MPVNGGPPNYKPNGCSSGTQHRPYSAHRHQKATFAEMGTRLEAQNPDRVQPESRPARVRTRLLRRAAPETHPAGFGAGHPDQNAESSASDPIAVMVIIDGPGSGNAFQLSNGFLRVGRGDGQDIQLAHDNTVSRNNHAVVGYVPDCGKFAIFDGGKVNPIWVNNRLLSDMSFLESGDVVRIGETSLRFEAA